jgi:PAS domain-containing protein
MIGKTLWDLSIDNMSDADWRTHRQQLEWRVIFKDLEIRRVYRSGEVRYLSTSGEPIFDDRDQFKGYRGITRDITERRQAEALTQEPHRFDRAILEALEAPIAVLDKTGAVLTANQAWRALITNHSGAGTDVAVGSNYLAAWDGACGEEPLDGKAIAAGIRQVIAGERALFRYDCPCNSPTDRCWFALGVTRIAGETQARAVVSYEDITERKRGELLLGLELTVARCLADADTVTVALQSVIRAVCETQGWDCGRYFSMDQSRGARGASMALAPETSENGAYVFPVTAADRVIGALAFSGTKVLEPDDRMLHALRAIGGQLGRFLLRQQAMNALRVSEMRFRVLTNLASDWHWEQDVDFRLTKVVGSCAFGIPDALGLRHWDLPLVVADAAWAEHKSQLAARWSFCDFEFAILQANGTRAHYSISGEPVYDEAGMFTGYCGIGVDVTRRKRAEIEVRESEARMRGTMAR